jgi:U3 small nucleolar RNA-associated protein 14
MPGRVSSGRPLALTTRARPTKRKSRKSATLNALELAEQQNPTQVKIQQHRLGEIDDDEENRADLDERSVKRRKIDVNKDVEDQVEGSDSEGNKWHTGVGEDDDDSDLDSDEAFGDSDEEKFADFTFRGSSTPYTSMGDRLARQRNTLRKEINLDEDAMDESDDMDEDGDDVSYDSLGPDAVDLATAWDMNNSDEGNDDTTEKSTQKQKRQAENDMSDENDSDDVDGDGDEISELSFSDEDDAEGKSKLVKFVQGLEANHDVKESLETAKGTKLSLATLLAASQDPSHRRALKVVQNREKVGPENYTGGIPGKLAPPLAKRQQDRLERAAAYDKSKETLSRWIDTVKQNRRADHISFPLQDPSDGTAAGIKALATVSQSAPLNSLEATVQEIMQESGLGTRPGQTADEQEAAFEELQIKTMPVEEVQARRVELRRNRELMFREEIRARRIKKIKSKSYRRVHRKERDRLAVHERELLEREGGINSEEERERNDRRRAETRMGARHKESRWAKAVKASGRATWDDDAGGGLTELARKDEELRRRMEGRQIRNSDGSGEEDEDSESEYQGFSEGEDSRRLQHKLDQLTAQEDDQPKSKLASMAFMQRAEALKRKANNDAVESMQRILRKDAGEQESSDEEELETAGRTRYGQPAQVQPSAGPRTQNLNEFEERLSEDEFEPKSDIPEYSEIAMPSVNSSINMQAKTLQRPPKAVKPVVPIPQKSRIQPKSRSRSTAKPVQFLDDVTSSSGSDEETLPTPTTADGPIVTRQEEMVRMLFAGDDVVYDNFDAEKKDTIVEEGDQVTSTSLPGWGAWTGEGISKREQKRNARNTRTVTTVRGVSQDQRKDKNLDRVIINEKRIKKNGKYLASELPHPFETRQQYERSLRLPLGPEWTTKNTFQDATKPRVLLKQGIIKPMARPML